MLFVIIKSIYLHPYHCTEYTKQPTVSSATQLQVVLGISLSVLAVLATLLLISIAVILIKVSYVNNFDTLAVNTINSKS